MEYRKGAHTRYDLRAHIVFVPKYRKRILYGVVGSKVRTIIRQVCDELEVEIISGKIAVDHVHMFVSYPPQISASEMVQKIKGKSAYKIFATLPNLRKELRSGHFWARGYLIVSVGNVTDELIQRYIEEQDGDDMINDNFIVSD